MEVEQKGDAYPSVPSRAWLSSHPVVLDQISCVNGLADGPLECIKPSYLDWAKNRKNTSETRPEVYALLETLIADTVRLASTHKDWRFKVSPQWVFILRVADPYGPDRHTNLRDWANAAYTLASLLRSDPLSRNLLLSEDPPLSFLQLYDIDVKAMGESGISNTERPFSCFCGKILALAWLKWASHAGLLEAAIVVAYDYHYDDLYGWTNPFACLWSHHVWRLERKGVSLGSVPTLGDYLLVKNACDSYSLSTLLHPSVRTLMVRWASIGLVPAMADILYGDYVTVEPLIGVEIALAILDTQRYASPLFPHVGRVWRRKARRYIASRFGFLPKDIILDEVREWIQAAWNVVRLFIQLEATMVARRQRKKNMVLAAQQWWRTHQDDHVEGIAIVAPPITEWVEAASAWSILQYADRAQLYWDRIMQAWVKGEVEPSEEWAVVEAACASPCGRCLSYGLRALSSVRATARANPVLTEILLWDLYTYHIYRHLRDPTTFNFPVVKHSPPFIRRWDDNEVLWRQVLWGRSMYGTREWSIEPPLVGKIMFKSSRLIAFPRLVPTILQLKNMCERLEGMIYVPESPLVESLFTVWTRRCKKRRRMCGSNLHDNNKPCK